MRYRSFVWVLIIISAACGNEPYDTGSINVISVVDTKRKISNTFQYKSNYLSKFTSTNTASSTVVTSSKFYTDNGQLLRIVSDSSATGYHETLVRRSHSRIEADSTFLVQALVRTIILSRRFEYEGDHITSATMTSFPSQETIRYEYTWSEGNITATSTFGLGSGSKIFTGADSVKFDTRKNIYNSDPIFLYTLPLSKLYWLSGNNPLTIKEAGTRLQKLTFIYNKFQYPSLYKVDVDANSAYAVSYTEMRK